MQCEIGSGCKETPEQGGCALGQLLCFLSLPECLGRAAGGAGDGQIHGRVERRRQNWEDQQTSIESQHLMAVQNGTTMCQSHHHPFQGRGRSRGSSHGYPCPWEITFPPAFLLPNVSATGCQLRCINRLLTLPSFLSRVYGFSIG